MEYIKNILNLQRNRYQTKDVQTLHLPYIFPRESGFFLNFERSLMSTSHCLT